MTRTCANMLPTSLNRLLLNKLDESSAASKLGVGGVAPPLPVVSLLSVLSHILSSPVSVSSQSQSLSLSNEQPCRRRYWGLSFDGDASSGPSSSSWSRAFSRK